MLQSLFGGEIARPIIDVLRVETHTCMSAKINRVRVVVKLHVLFCLGCCGQIEHHTTDTCTLVTGWNIGTYSTFHGTYMNMVRTFETWLLFRPRYPELQQMVV